MRILFKHADDGTEFKCTFFKIIFSAPFNSRLDFDSHIEIDTKIYVLRVEELFGLFPPINIFLANYLLDFVCVWKAITHSQRYFNANTIIFVTLIERIQCINLSQFSICRFSFLLADSNSKMLFSRVY